MRVMAFAGKMGSGKDTAAAVLLARGYVRVALADELKRLARAIYALSDEALFGPSAARNAPFDASEAYWAQVHARIDEQRPWLTQLFADAPTVLHDPTVWLHTVTEAHMRAPACTARTILQFLGTEWGRDSWRDVWVNQVGKVYEQLRLGGWHYEARRGLVLSENRGFRYAGMVVTDARFANEMEAVHRWGGLVYWIDASRRLSSNPPPGLDGRNVKHASEGEFAALQEHVDKLITNNGTLDDLERDVLHYCAGDATGRYRALSGDG